MTPVTNYSIPNCKPRNPRSDFNHDPYIAVPERQWLIELALHRIHCHNHTVRAHLFEYFPNLFGLLANFTQPPRLTEVNEHPLSSSRQHAPDCCNPEMPRPDTWRRHVVSNGVTIPKIL
jgi:hypothetical protein